MGQCCGSGYVITPESKAIDQDLKKLGEILKNEIKLLLLGTGESGKSTVFKQMKILQDKGGFLPEELENYKNIIRGNCISQMRALVTACVKLGNAFDSEEHTQLAQSISSLESYRDLNSEVASAIAMLWTDRGIRQSYEQQGPGFQLDDSASYLFENVGRYATPDYTPSHQDILRARTRTTGVDEAIFIFNDMEFRMIDVGGQRSERRKWISTFDCVTAVLFCISIAEYDQVLREDRTQNRMRESLLLFEEIFNSKIFERIDFILFFNKMDLFPDKVATKPLTICFPDYPGSTDVDYAKNYIADRFLELRNMQNTRHKAYHHFTCAIDRENMKKIFMNVKRTLLDETLHHLQI